MTPVTCLYCGVVTGSSFESDRTTVCFRCQWLPDRSERREILAGQRPWARPLSFWSNRENALPDDEAVKAQSAWDRWQNWVAKFNKAHYGCNCSPSEQANGHRRASDFLPKCFAPQAEAAFAALTEADKHAYEDYRREIAEHAA